MDEKSSLDNILCDNILIHSNENIFKSFLSRRNYILDIFFYICKVHFYYIFMNDFCLT